MSNALKLQNSPESDWTIVTGPKNGTRMHMTEAQFSLGRSHECDIALPGDPKVSRKHARVYWSGDGFRIQSLVDQNPVLINGRPVSDESLNSGTIIQLGDTKIKFEGRPQMMVAPAPDLQIAPFQMPGQFGPPQPPPINGGMAMPASRRPKKKTPETGNTKRLLIYGIVAAGLWFLLSPSNSNKKSPFGLRTEKQIEADIEEAHQLTKLANETRASRLFPTLSERQAQEHYVKGFRDFRKGQFERSQESFQACLALSPNHALCNRYLNLSRKKFNELVQYHMVLGRKYRDQNQFRACRSSFRNVMVMVKDPSSVIYNEARSNYEACNSLVEGRF